MSEYPSEYFKSATVSKDEWQAPKSCAARSTTFFNAQPEIETKNRLSSLGGIREFNSVDKLWEVSESLNCQTATDKNNPQHVSPKVVKRRPCANTETFEINSNSFGNFCSQTHRNSVQTDFLLRRDETSDVSPRSGKAVKTQPNMRPNTITVRCFTMKRPTASVFGDSIIKEFGNRK